MKISLTLALLSLLLSSAGASAQDSADIKAIKKRYQAVNQRMKKAQRHDVDIIVSTEGGSVECYTDQEKLIRIVVDEMGESYRAHREFTYDEQERLVFVFDRVIHYNAYFNHDKSKSEKIEERAYYKEGRPLRFLRKELTKKKPQVALDLKKHRDESISKFEEAEDTRSRAQAKMKADNARDLKAIKANYKSVNARMKNAKAFKTTLLLSTEGEGVTLYTYEDKLIRIVVDDTGETYRAKIEFTYDSDEKLNFIFSRLTRYHSQIGDPSFDERKSRVAKEERLYLKEGRPLRYLVTDFDEQNKGNVEVSLSKNRREIQSHLDYAKRVREGARAQQRAAD